MRACHGCYGQELSSLISHGGVGEGRVSVKGVRLLRSTGLSLQHGRVIAGSSARVRRLDSCDSNLVRERPGTKIDLVSTWLAFMWERTRVSGRVQF